MIFRNIDFFFVTFCYHLLTENYNIVFSKCKNYAYVTSCSHLPLTIRMAPIMAFTKDSLVIKR